MTPGLIRQIISLQMVWKRLSVCKLEHPFFLKPLMCLFSDLCGFNLLNFLDFLFFKDHWLVDMQYESNRMMLYNHPFSAANPNQHADGEEMHVKSGLKACQLIKMFPLWKCYIHLCMNKLKGNHRKNSETFRTIVTLFAKWLVDSKC